MITLFEKFNWWKKDKDTDVVDTSKYYSIEEPLTTFINELDKDLTNIQFQRAVCGFINDKLIGAPGVIFEAVKITNRNFQYDICLHNKKWYDGHKNKYRYPFDARLNPMLYGDDEPYNNTFLLTLTEKKSEYGWDVFSFIIYMDDLKNMLVDREIKYNRINTIEDPSGEAYWD